MPKTPQRTPYSHCGTSCSTLNAALNLGNNLAPCFSKKVRRCHRVCCSPAIQHQIVQQIESELRASPPCCRQPNARLPVSRVPPSVRCSHERPKLPKALGWSRLKLKPVATRN